MGLLATVLFELHATEPTQKSLVRCAVACDLVPSWEVPTYQAWNLIWFDFHILLVTQPRRICQLEFLFTTNFENRWTSRLFFIVTKFTLSSGGGSPILQPPRRSKRLTFWDGTDLFFSMSALRSVCIDWTELNNRGVRVRPSLVSCIGSNPIYMPHDPSTFGKQQD